MTAHTRDRILDATRKLYLRHGNRGVTMRAVAGRVGLTPTALYRHFPSRNALVAEVVADGFRVFGSYLYAALKGKTPEERLERAGAAYLRFALEQPAMYRTLFMDRPVGEVSATPAGGQGARQAATFRFLVDRVEECLAAGFLRPGKPEEIARAIWAQVHGLISLHLVGTFQEDDHTFREAYRTSLAMIFRGLALRPPTGSPSRKEEAR